MKKMNLQNRDGKRVYEAPYMLIHALDMGKPVMVIASPGRPANSSATIDKQQGGTIGSSDISITDDPFGVNGNSNY